MSETILKLIDVSKSFPGVQALKNVSLNVYEGEVMALLGENGAGKSTLMKCLAGILTRDEGTIVFKGRNVVYQNARQAQEDGIAVIHQELNLIPKMNVYENIYLGRELRTKRGILDKKKMIKATQELLAGIRVHLDPRVVVGTLSIAQQQMVEIAKALLLNAKLIVMDEPTDTLPDEEVGSLFSIIRALRNQGKGIVYITHRLNEVFEICDKATILRDGAFIDEVPVSELTQGKLISMMVGRDLEHQFPYEPMECGEVVLKVEGLTNEYIRDISFHLRRGEVLGVAGLVGAGRTELAKTLYGLFSWEAGSAEIANKPFFPKNPRQAIDMGLYYMTEDRKRNGLVLLMDVAGNTTLSALIKIQKHGVIDYKKEKRIVQDFVGKMRIKTPSLQQKARNLSGGNQQKVVLAKALLTEPEVLILDEPTRGIDVGAKKEIYLLINELKSRGKAIIMISSEMPEILGMSDRIMVLHDGRKKGELQRAEATQEKIMELALSVDSRGRK